MRVVRMIRAPQCGVGGNRIHVLRVVGPLRNTSSSTRFEPGRNSRGGCHVLVSLKYLYAAVAVEWPEEFPHACPPGDATEPTGRVIRLVRDDPPVPSDFQSVALEQPHRSWNSADEECRAHGLSVHRDPSDAEAVMRRFASMRNRRLAIADITDAGGLMKPTPSRLSQSHITWWLPLNALPSNLAWNTGQD